MNRREFVISSSLASGALFAPFSIFGKEQKLNVGIVGTGWWGTDLLMPALLKSGHFEIIGLCDVDSAHLDNAAKKLSETSSFKAKLFKDYRDLYEMKGLDAVVIATPPHWHALQLIDASKKGLHVFLEKPVFYDISEGQAMQQEVEQSGILVQVDFERLRMNSYQEVTDYISQGKAGKIFQVEAQINFHLKGIDTVEKEIPETLDFDAWCGPAPVGPYLCPKDSDSTTINWRAMEMYGRGHLYDWGIHHIHSIRNILKLDLPDSVTAFGGNTRYVNCDTPDYLNVRFDFGDLPVIWNHKIWGTVPYTPEVQNGIFLYGEKATIFVSDEGWIVTPAGKDQEKEKHGFESAVGNDVIAIISDHMTEFANAVKTDSPENLLTGLKDSCLTTECVNLADIAYRTGESIAFDPDALKITSPSAANSYLKRDYRKPYNHPFKS